MNNPKSAFLEKVNAVAEECAVFRFATRDSDLQKEACGKLGDLLAQITAEKESAMAALEEDYADALLGCECAVGALIAEIRMWLLLKEERPDAAWDQLVTAQENVSAAMVAHDGFQHFDEHVRRLEAVESLVFPPQVFLSSGMIVKSQICSICGGEYEDCPHVKGRPYMGRFCTVRLIPSKVDHVSIVQSPADKRCRVVKFSAEGGYRNRMTWRVEPGNTNAKGGDPNPTAQAIIATTATLAE
jgi:hypothetical protein